MYLFNNINLLTDEKTGQAAAAYSPRWQQYSWSSYSNSDNGLIKEEIFTKKENETSLRITWNGNLRIQSCSSCCRRWYFTIDGVECNPRHINGLLYQVRLLIKLGWLLQYTCNCVNFLLRATAWN